MEQILNLNKELDESVMKLTATIHNYEIQTDCELLNDITIKITHFYITPSHPPPLPTLYWPIILTKQSFAPIENRFKPHIYAKEYCIKDRTYFPTKDSNTTTTISNFECLSRAISIIIHRFCRFMSVPIGHVDLSIARDSKAAWLLPHPIGLQALPFFLHRFSDVS